MARERDLVTNGQQRILPACPDPSCCVNNIRSIRMIDKPELTKVVTKHIRGTGDIQRIQPITSNRT
jgi:hypothetical protein